MLRIQWFLKAYFLFIHYVHDKKLNTLNSSVLKPLNRNLDK